MYPFIYDVNKKSLSRIELNPILSITDVKYDYDTNTVYFAGWLKEDEDRIIKEGYNIPIPRYIYSYQLELVYKG